MARKKKTLITYEVFIRRSGKETVLLTTTDKKAAEKAYRQNRCPYWKRINSWSAAGAPGWSKYSFSAVPKNKRICTA